MWEEKVQSNSQRFDFVQDNSKSQLDSDANKIKDKEMKEELR